MGICSICSMEFPDQNLNLYDTLSLCNKDETLYKKNKWIKIVSSTSDPENPQEALKTQECKDQLKIHNIPSYITVEYSEKDGVIYSNFKLFIPENLIQKYKDLDL